MLTNNWTTRLYLKTTGIIMIRVRWNSKKYEFSQSLGYRISEEKWDASKQLVKANTTFRDGNKIIYAKDINAFIRSTVLFIDKGFEYFNSLSVIPTVSEFKDWLRNSKESSVGSSSSIDVNDISFSEVFEIFIKERPKEGSFTSTTLYKYKQMFNQVSACKPGISLSQFNLNFMNELIVWYVENGYCNRTIQKQIKILKSCLRWFVRRGYKVSSDVFTFKPKLKVIPKTVTYLKYNELMKFLNYTFPTEKNYLSKARDLFCFMCFTSLRYSDLASLKHSHIIDDQIEMFSEKTDGKLIIPLTKQAKQLIDKYSWYEADTIFPVPSNQKLNDYLKKAAEMAGLDRLVSQTYFKGNDRYEKTAYFYEQISCHDARRTFVVCSLSFGIPLSIVMKSTGHSDFESMKPYIEVQNETQRLEMDKWNTHQYKSGIIEKLDKMSSEQLKKVFEYVAGVSLR